MCTQCYARHPTKFTTLTLLAKQFPTNKFLLAEYLLQLCIKKTVYFRIDKSLVKYKLYVRSGKTCLSPWPLSTLHDRARILVTPRDKRRAQTLWYLTSELHFSSTAGVPLKRLVYVIWQLLSCWVLFIYETQMRHFLWSAVLQIICYVEPGFKCEILNDLREWRGQNSW